MQIDIIVSIYVEYGSIFMVQRTGEDGSYFAVEEAEWGGGYGHPLSEALLHPVLQLGEKAGLHLQSFQLVATWEGISTR